MAPSVTPPSDAPRPLPRRSVPSQATRTARPPRLVPLDALWIAALALLSVAVSTLLPHPSRDWRTGAALASATVVLLYLLGWRARDRAAGVIAGLLAATSLTFLHHALSAPLDAAFVLLAVASLFSLVAGSSLIALGCAGLASAVRPDGLLLGLVLLGLALAQRRRRAGLGAAAFVLLAGAGWALRSGLGRAAIPATLVGSHAWLFTWAVTGGTVFVTWLLLPFVGELGEAPRRARWLPVVLWTLAYLVVESFVQVGTHDATVFGLMPLWFALAGAGLSRLLPALTGDIPLPWVRYGLATLAVLSLVAIRGRAEWPPVTVMPHTTSGPMHTAPAAVKPAAILVPAAVTAAIVHHAAAPKAAPRAVPKKNAPKAAPKKAAPKKAAPKKAAPKKAAPKKAVPKAAAQKAPVHPIFRARPVYRRYRPFYRRRYPARFRR